MFLKQKSWISLKSLAFTRFGGPNGMEMGGCFFPRKCFFPGDKKTPSIILQLNRFEDSIKAYDEALRIDPEYSKAFYN